MSLSKFDLSLVIEALRSARCEIEALENDLPEYVTTGRLIDQLVAGEAILVREKAVLQARAERRAAKQAASE